MKEDAGRSPQTVDHTPDETAPEINADAPQTHKETPADIMNRVHRRIAQNAQKKAVEAIAQIAPEGMTANEARLLLKTAQDIERRITEGRRDPDRQREDVQALQASVWEAAKRG